MWRNLQKFDLLSHSLAAVEADKSGTALSIFPRKTPRLVWEEARKRKFFFQGPLLFFHHAGGRVDVNEDCGFPFSLGLDTAICFPLTSIYLGRRRSSMFSFQGGETGPRLFGRRPHMGKGGDAPPLRVKNKSPPL